MSERSKPDFCYDSGCPLAHKSRGFSVGYGDPCTARVAACGEGLGAEEVAYRLDNRFGKTAEEIEEDKKELERRKRDYPDLPVKFLVHGAPFVGKAGQAVNSWMLGKVGLDRRKMFIDNTLRCLPPKYGDSNYPTGWERKKAEACCRHYDRWHLMKPEISICVIHPASILREMTPLPLVVRSGFQKARDFAAAGKKVLLLLGGKAVKFWLGYAENVTRWQGHYAWETEGLEERRARRAEEGMHTKPPEKKTKKKKVEK